MIFAGLVVAQLAASLVPSTSTPARPPELAHHIVVVDAGHGGPDKGMSGPIGADAKHRIYEKTITLAVAKRLGQVLAARGLTVVYTRTTDTLIALADRGKIANQAGADLFLSIHVNASNPTWKDPAATRGFETYFLSEAHTEDAQRVAEMENESTRYETDSGPVGKDDPLNFILNDMQQNTDLRESSQLADLIQRRLVSVEPGPSRGVKQAGFRVLVTAYMPAVLVEIGYGTNAADADFIANPKKQGLLANAIADAAVDFLHRHDRRVTGGGGTRR